MMIRSKGFMWAAGAALCLGVVAVSAQEATETPMMGEMSMSGASAYAEVVDTAGTVLGTVSFSEMEDGIVMIEGELEGLTPGFHGYHVHEVGVCDPSGEMPFDSAGEHLNLTGADHEEHSGDLPVLYALTDGSASLSVHTDRFTVADLLEGDGTAIIVHANPDNFTNIPERYGGPDEETLTSGDSGDRIACGVITEGMMMDDMSGMDMTPEATMDMMEMTPEVTPAG